MHSSPPPCAAKAHLFHVPLACTRPPPERGLTLVEVIVTIAVIAVLASIAMPFVVGLPGRRAFEGAAAELAADIRYARAESVARNAAVTIGFKSDQAGSCYVVYTGAGGACDCRTGAIQQGTPACNAGVAHLKGVGFPATGAVQVQSNVAAMSFSPLYGVASPAGTITVRGPQNAAINHVVSLSGRVRSCTLGSASFGLRAC